MENNKFKTKWEFVFMFNDNIICQRYFDVRGYNNKSLKSYNLKEAVDDICDDILASIKQTSLDYMNDNIYKFYSNPNFDGGRVMTDVFTFRVDVEGVTKIEKIMDAGVYPKEVRYSIDIRDKIFDIISKLTKALSSNELELI